MNIFQIMRCYQNLKGVIKMKEPHEQYSYIIFDLDGTLVDTCPDLVKTVQYIIKKYQFEEK
ncbi:HAD hydrolase-like protein, partial [Pseudoramibacter alactolyticus]|uniref:HAD family hydrolase n=1 Tax=Pseudoramibacter alactolyticus TaxID=113287 RepID=UPI0028D34758